MADTFWGKFMRCAKDCGLFCLDCAFLIDWAGNNSNHMEYTSHCKKWHTCTVGLN